MSKHKHAELIKLWVDNIDTIVIEWYVSGESTWVVPKNITWDYSQDYRIKPDCEYVLNFIRDTHGGHALELYNHWLDGGVLRLKTFTVINCSIKLADECFDPFWYFCDMYPRGKFFRPSVAQIP